MPSIKITMTIDLADYGSPYQGGPVFHRWLPKGKASAIELPASDPKAELRIWFERRGYLSRGDPGYIEYQRNIYQVDPVVLERQAQLEAGPLTVELLLHEVPEKQAEAVRRYDFWADKESESELYLTLGKRVYRLIQPPIDQFIRVLRCMLGQYWLIDSIAWDSRSQSLGSYFLTLHAKWHILDEHGQGAFIPNPPERTIHAGPMGGRFDFFITKHDWEQIQTSDVMKFDFGVESALMTHAHELANEGHLKHAFVEAVAALEAIVKNRIQDTVSHNTKLTETISPLHQSNLEVKVIAVSKLSGTVPDDDLEKTLDAIAIRNDVAHGNKPRTEDPTNGKEPELYGLLRCAAQLLYPVNAKFPVPKPGSNMQIMKDE